MKFFISLFILTSLMQPIVGKAEFVVNPRIPSKGGVFPAGQEGPIFSNRSFLMLHPNFLNHFIHSSPKVLSSPKSKTAPETPSVAIQSGE